MKKQPLLDLVPHSNVLMAIKREFTRSTMVDIKFKSLRITKARYNKDGTKSKVPDVWYPCEMCNQEFKQKDIQVDHLEPVVPVQIPAKHMSWNVLIEERCFVKTVDQLQLLCKPCHSLKTKKENQQRKEWRTKEKHIVYVTFNSINGKMYIGVHKCIDLNDGYMGSGYALKAAIKKHGLEFFYRKVLYCYDNAKDAYNKERELVDEDTVKSPMYYNLVGGGRTPGVLSEQSKNKRSQNLKGKRTSSRLRIKVIATNLRTGQKREFPSILECAQTLKLSYSAVLKVCKSRYGMSKVHDWTFETEKYGKALPAKVNPNPGIAKTQRGYIVWDGKKYVGFRKTLEQALELQKEYNS